ncbi:MAG: triose-phosphate isomerase, partial [Clostridiales bacterium]|nr:triose-phosphate isomerase [Clostridiales bacterium]
MRRPLIAGNWKMYKTTSEAVEFVEAFIPLMGESDIEVALCVPFTQLLAVKEAIKDTKIKLGAQNMHYDDEGAFTGEISP